MWVDAQRDGRPAEYRWRPLRKLDAKLVLHVANFRQGAKAPQNVYIVYQSRRRPKIVQSLVGLR